MKRPRVVRRTENESVLRVYINPLLFVLQALYSIGRYRAISYVQTCGLRLFCESTRLELTRATIDDRINTPPKIALAFIWVRRHRVERKSGRAAACAILV